MKCLRSCFWVVVVTVKSYLFVLKDLIRKKECKKLSSKKLKNCERTTNKRIIKSQEQGNLSLLVL